MVNVICMKWGTRYGPEYVNHLASMVRRHLTLPHRFVCFTEDTTGIAAGVETRSLPAVFPRGTGPERYWNKLGIFARPLADINGPVLALDLDLVVVGSLDGFFEMEGRFCIIKDFSSRAGQLEGNSSACRFTAGAHPEVLEDYIRNPKAIEEEYWFDQHYISAKLRPVTFWPAEWCRSFKKHCLPPVPRCYFQRPTIPPGASIIVFHGHPNPPDAIRGCLVRGGIKYCRPTPWVAEHWR
jgi:hypothetical protein